MRALKYALAIIMMALAFPAAARTPFDGVWLFDDAPSYPGVTMMEVQTRGDRITGSVTTKWYGPIEMQHARLVGGELEFDVRNLNDRGHPTRTWSAVVGQSGAITLSGDIWYAHVEQAGQRGTLAQAKSRQFRFEWLPSLGTVAPDGLAMTPPMGWSSWNRFAEKIDDRTIREIADAIVSNGLRDAGYVYVNIDDGWQGERGPDGEIRPNAHFPDMKGLADYLHARGLKLGIYTSPGPRSCAGFEGSYGHVEQDARTFARWGVDYVKYDLCSGEWFYDDADKVRRSYYQMGAALKATGRPIIYSLCEYGRFDVGSWGRTVGGHLWRTTGDIEDKFDSMERIGFEKNPPPSTDARGGWNDPDMLEIGNGGMSEEEYRTHMTLWAMSAAPLIMGHDVRKTDPASLRILTNRELIAIDQDSKGIQGRKVRSEAAGEVWAKPLADGTVAVALFNRGNTAAEMSLLPADAGFSSLTMVRDLWRGVDLDPRTSRLSVPAHGTVIVKIGGQQGTSA